MPGGCSHGPLGRDPMLRVDWNALRTGDRVLVHDGDDAMRLVAGVVVSTAPGAGSNAIAIKLTGGGSDTVEPQRLTVHHDPIEFDGHCWRCTTIDGAASRPKRAQS